MSKIAEVKKGLTVRSLVIGIALLAISSFFMGFFHWGPGGNGFGGYAAPPGYFMGIAGKAWRAYAVYDRTGFEGPMTFVFMWFFVFSLILSAIPRRILTPQERTVVFTMLAIGLILSIPWLSIGGTGFFNKLVEGAEEFDASDTGGWITDVPGQSIGAARSWFLPFDGVQSGTEAPYYSWAFYPEDPFPWIDYLPSLAHYTMIGFLWFGVFVTTAIWFRRAFTDVEALPYPNSTAAVTLTGLEEDKPSIIKNKWLWAGLALGVAMCSSSIILWLDPSKPDLALGESISQVDFSKLGLATQMIPAYLSLNPAAYGFSLLTPIGILMSTVLFIFILYWIMPPILITQGLPHFTTGQRANYLVYWLTGNHGSAFIMPGFVGYRFLAGGAIIGVMAWILWHHRGILFRRWTKEEEAKEPWSWKTQLILWLVFLLGYVAYCAIAGAVEWFVLAGTLILLMFDVVFARLRGEYTAYGGLGQDTYPTMGNSNGAMVTLLSRGYPPYGMIWWDSRLTSGLTAAAGASQIYFWGPTAGIGYPMGAMMESFKLSNLTNTRKRDLVIAAIIGPIVGMSIGWISQRMAFKWFGNPVINQGVINQYNGEEANMIGSDQLGLTEYGPLYLRELYSRVPGNGTQYPGFEDTVLWTIIVGAVIAFVLLYMQGRFKRPPLSSLGWGFTIAIIGSQASYGGGIIYAFFPMLISLILKWFIVRAYGAKAFEEKVIPLGVGLIVMTAIMVLTDDLVSLYAMPWEA